MVGKVTFKKGAKIERWEKALENPKAALKQIGALMVSESQAAFKRQKFGTTKWVERAVPNVYGIIADFHAGKPSPPQRRFESRPALKDTGRLSSSFEFNLIGSDAVEVGLPPKISAYASVHHFGGKIESKPITSEVQSLLWNWLKSKSRGLKSQLGWLLNKKFTGTTLKGEVEARPFIGITRQTLKDVEEAVGVHILEVGK